MSVLVSEHRYTNISMNQKLLVKIYRFYGVMQNLVKKRQKTIYIIDKNIYSLQSKKKTVLIIFTPVFHPINFTGKRNPGLTVETWIHGCQKIQPLPIQPKPGILYNMRTLEKSGFKKVLIDRRLERVFFQGGGGWTRFRIDFV